MVVLMGYTSGALMAPWHDLWWLPSFLLWQIYWSFVICWGLYYTHYCISSFLPRCTLCPHALLLSLNIKCIFTYDGIWRRQASGSVGLLQRPVILCWASHWHYCHLAFSWHCRCHPPSCQWGLSASQDCLVLALWWATWLLGAKS